MSEAIVRLRGPDTDWLHLGADTAARGIVAEGLNLTANEQGPDTCSFTLKRSPRFTWPDLLPFAMCEVEIAGVVVWGGRIWETPGQDGTGKSLSVTGRGWQYHLDDDLYAEKYVTAGLEQWQDARTAVPDANLTTAYTTVGQVRAGDGRITLTWPGPSVMVQFISIGVLLDFGAEDLGPKRAVVQYETNQDATDRVLYVRSHTLSDEQASVTAGSYSNAIAGTSMTTLGRTGTTAGTFAARRRYVTCSLVYTGGAGTAPTEYAIGFLALRMFGDTAWESGNASILKASQVVTDVLASGALPLLDTSTALIETSSFSIPEYAPQGSQTPRDHIAAVNAYHDNLWGVDAQRRLYFKARPTTTGLETGAWAGADYSDSGGGAERLYNKVLVSYTGPDGASAEEETTATSSLLNRLGFTRTARLNVGAAITSTAAGQIGDVWIAEKTTPSLKGSLNLRGHGAVRTTQGIGLDPAHLLIRAGQKIRLTHRQDSNGGIGLDGTIRSVTYNHEARSVGLELDQERGRFEALMARLGVVQAAIR